MAHRTFTDSRGRSWNVWTVVPSRVERRRTPTLPPDGLERRRREEFRVLLADEWAEGWLAFETDGEKRRLAPFPPDWWELPPDRLDELRERAAPVRAARKLA